MLNGFIKYRMARYQVFTQRDTTTPRFSAPWYWLASIYSTIACGNRDYCQIADVKHGKPMMEWARASGVGPKENKLCATQLARRSNTSTAAIQQKLIELGYIEVRSGLHYLTDVGRSVGGEYRKNHSAASDVDGHMVWPIDVPLADSNRPNNK